MGSRGRTQFQAPWYGRGTSLGWGKPDYPLFEICFWFVYFLYEFPVKRNLNFNVTNINLWIFVSTKKLHHFSPLFFSVLIPAKFHHHHPSFFFQLMIMRFALSRKHLVKRFVCDDLVNEWFIQLWFHLQEGINTRNLHQHVVILHRVERALVGYWCYDFSGTVMKINSW